MEIQTEFSDLIPLVIIHIEGKLDMYSSHVLKEESAALLLRNEKALIIDFEKTKYADSAGIGSLISLLTTMKKHGWETKFINLNEVVLGIIKLTRLDTFFPISGTMDEARKALGFPVERKISNA